jgi:hypothetical protein
MQAQFEGKFAGADWFAGRTVRNQFVAGFRSVEPSGRKWKTRVWALRRVSLASGVGVCVLDAMRDEWAAVASIETHDDKRTGAATAGVVPSDLSQWSWSAE